MNNVLSQAAWLLSQHNPDKEPHAQCERCDRLFRVSQIKLLTVLATKKSVARGVCRDCYPTGKGGAQ